MSSPNKKQASKGNAKEPVQDKSQLPDAQKSGKSEEPGVHEDPGRGGLVSPSQEQNVQKENAPPKPPFIFRPSPSLPASYYAFYSCEGHCYDLFEKFVSKHENMSPRAKHAATLFLMTAVHIAKTLRMDVHRAAIWLSIAWVGFKFALEEKNKSSTQLDRYFEEILIRHSVDSSPLGCEVFSETESRALQRFLCRFTRLLPLLQIYLYKMAGVEPTMEKSKYLGGVPCSSEIDLPTEVMGEESTIMMASVECRPKDFRRVDDYFKCSEDYFRKLWMSQG